LAHSVRDGRLTLNEARAILGYTHDGHSA
jgi:hypothetical protein